MQAVAPLEKTNRIKVFLLALLAALIIFASIGCSGKAAQTNKSGGSNDAISWSKAGDHIGESIAVKGPVVSTKYASSSNGQPTFLNMGKDYPDPGRFTVVIWNENRGNFDSMPEDYYEGKNVIVTGEISEYQGVAQIEVEGPNQIEEQ